MSYHVAITRERHGEISAILLEDWLEHVRTSADLEFCDPVGDDAVSQFTRSIHAADWKGTEGAWLGWSNGEIWTKNPSPALIEHMISLAPKFRARVRGDEGEFYHADGSCHAEKDGQNIPWAEHLEDRMAGLKRHKRNEFYWNCARALLLLLVVAAFVWKRLRQA